MTINRLTPGQSVYLNAVRYVAAMTVCLHHALGYFYGDAYRAISQAHPMTNLGTIGVMTFFVLSGFLIAYTIQRKTADDTSYDAQVFAIERVARIYLVFVPAVLLIYAVNVINVAWVHDTVSGAEFFTAENAVFTAAMLAGVRGISGHSELMPLAGPAWTINYEFWFYMLFGLAMLPIKRISAWASWLIRTILFVGILSFAATLDLFRTMALAWFAGAALGMLFAWRGALPWTTAIAVSIGAVAYARMVPDPDPGTLLILTSAGVLLTLGLKATQRFHAPARVTSVIARLAGYSYSLYLTHVVVIWAIRHFGHVTGRFHLDFDDGRKLFWFGLTLVVTNLFALGFAKITEDHTNRVRRLFLRPRIPRLPDNKPLLDPI